MLILIRFFWSGGDLGIADDIRPKKFRSISKKEIELEIKVAKRKIAENEPSPLFGSNDNEDDFFANTPIRSSDRIANAKYQQKPKKNGKKRNHRWVYTFVIILAILALIGLVVWQNFPAIKNFYDGEFKKNNAQSLDLIINQATGSGSGSYSAASPSPSTTTSPMPSSTENSNASITISVLNGNGIKNSASSIATTLKQAGFNVTNTGNAKSFNYSTTYVYYKTAGINQADAVKSALSGRTVTESLNNSVVGSKYDIVVVVGKN